MAGGQGNLNEIILRRSDFLRIFGKHSSGVKCEARVGLLLPVLYNLENTRFQTNGQQTGGS